MIPHISFTEMFQVAAAVFAVGMIAGAYAAFKLDGLFQKKFGSK